MGSLMADAQITTLTAGTSGPATISGLVAGNVAGTPTDITVTAPYNVTPTTTYNLGDYITGGIGTVKGDYTFGTNGVVASATYPGVTAVTAPGGQFK
jgi:hypothetical protein